MQIPRIGRRFIFWQLFMTSTSAFTQNAVESTQVAEKQIQLVFREKGSGKILRRTEVKIGGEIFYADKEGNLFLKSSLSSQEAEISRPGYVVLKLNLNELKADEKNEIFLIPDVPSDNEVIVRGKKRPEVSKKTISVSESIKVAPGGDPVQVAKLLPGVQQFGGRASSGLIIRGSGPEDSKFYLDDVELPTVFHPIGNLSVIPDQLLEELDFSTGGFGGQYGNATGGVINLKTKSTIPEKSQTELILKFPIYAGVYFEAPLSETSMYSISVRRSFIQYILPKIIDSMDEPLDINVVPYFGDFNGQYLKLLDDGSVKVTLFNVYDGLTLVAPFDQSADESGKGNFDLYTSSTFLSVQRLQKLDEKLSVKYTPNFSYETNRIDVLGNKFNLFVYKLNLPVEFTRRLQPGESIYFGADANYLTGDIELYSPRLVRDDPFFDFEDAPKVRYEEKFSVSTFASWIGVDKKFSDLTLSPSLRASKFNGVKDVAIDPRLSGRYALEKDDTLKFAYGQYSKGPEYDEANEEFGSLDLTYERSIHHILGWERNWTDKWTNDVQVFYKRNYKMIRTDPVTNLNNDGFGYSKGFEFFLRRNQTERLFGWLSYTYSESKEQANNESSELYTEYDQTHLLTLVGNYQLTGIWNVGGRASYSTGKVYTPINDAYYNANLDKYQPIVPQKDINSGRLPNITKLSVYMARDFLWDTSKVTMRFGLEDYVLGETVENVSNNYDYSEETKIKGIPVIPYLELRAKL